MYTVEITPTDISIEDKFMAVIYEQDSQDSLRTVYDVATSNSKAALRRWADQIVKGQ